MLGTEQWRIQFRVYEWKEEGEKKVRKEGYRRSLNKVSVKERKENMKEWIKFLKRWRKSAINENMKTLKWKYEMKNET